MVVGVIEFKPDTGDEEEAAGKDHETLGRVFFAKSKNLTQPEDSKDNDWSKAVQQIGF